MKFNNLGKALFALCCIFAGNSVNAASIIYEATDLPDLVVGEDLWKYTYTVSDHTFDTDNGFSIFFDPQLYSNLEDPAPVVNADWDTLVLQPDEFLPDDGLYDALSLANGASLSDPFILSFIWTGNGIPSAQPYETYDAAFNIVSSGTTESSVSTVPVPSSMILLASGLAGIAGFKKKNKNILTQNIPS